MTNDDVAHTLQEFLIDKFVRWSPQSPRVQGATHCRVDMCWLQDQRPFGFLDSLLLYRVQERGKLPPWVMVYSGGKATKAIDNLAPASPHQFRVQVILRDTGVPVLAQKALQYYGSAENIYEEFNKTGAKDADVIIEETTTKHDASDNAASNAGDKHTDGSGDCIVNGEENSIVDEPSVVAGNGGKRRRWLESAWSPENWCCTDTRGTSSACFCMAVRCGYHKQVQLMLEERPALVTAVNSSNGLTPLVTAIRHGDINMVKYLLNCGADVNQPSHAGQRPLHQAVYHRHLDIAALLLERGAHFQSQDDNMLRVEHYAADSGSAAVAGFVLDRGGDVHVTDRHGWTPLFRAVMQGACAELVQELLNRGSELDVVDRAGLTLAAAARMLPGQSGGGRDSILRLVDAHYTHDKALANFTRLTKKISSVHSLFKQ